ncbi:MFS transporter [Chryseobacterium sp. JK1]|uniref:MFS transporter n=1 Tax=Chryseobacterium sp. JK1 TaxID=874294 RepID=UPI003D69E4B7
MKSVYFKDWTENWKWISRITLFLLLLSGLVQLGMFVLTQSYMVSYWGAQPEDIWFGVMATYAGIITILPIQFRFLRYFETRSYLLFNLVVTILLNLACFYCQDLILFLVLRFFQGIFAGNVIVCSLTLVFSLLPPERSRSIGAAVFYGTMLSNTVLIGLASGIIVETFDWKFIYYGLIFFQIIMLGLVLLVLKRKSVMKSYPLYQTDFAGMAVFAVTIISIAYTLLYGSKYYWFEDSRICWSTLTGATGLFLFIYRQYTAKRPVVNLDVFHSPKFMIGLALLAIYYGTKDSINLIYNYTTGVLKWSTLDMITLALCNLSGMVLFLIIAIRLIIVKKISVTAFLAPGFIVLAGFNFWMSYFLTPDLSFEDLMLPIFVQGSASGLLFVPIMIFVLSSAPPHTGTTGLIVAAYTRFTATLNSFVGFYNLQLYFNQYFKEGFLNSLTSENQNTIDRLNSYKTLYISKGIWQEQSSLMANSQLAQVIAQQSQLLTNRAIFMTFGIGLSLVALLIMIIPLLHKTYMSLGMQKVPKTFSESLNSKA